MGQINIRYMRPIGWVICSLDVKLGKPSHIEVAYPICLLHANELLLRHRPCILYDPKAMDIY